MSGCGGYDGHGVSPGYLWSLISCLFYYLCRMREFLRSYFGEDVPFELVMLPRAGSDRSYGRVLSGDKTFICCANPIVKENQAFLYLSRFFLQQGIRVPEVYAVNENQTCYLIEDLGSECLLDRVIQNGLTSKVVELYKRVLQDLIHIQVSGSRIEEQYLYATKRFDQHGVMADLNYFKYYFLDRLPVSYSRYDFALECEQLAQTISSFPATHFMYRDFQGRNIMLKDELPGYIDFQGGMKGPLGYDVASLLWQAKANIPFLLKQELVQFYYQSLPSAIQPPREAFFKQYDLLVLIRLLQVLGAYGLKGIIEERPHFKESILQGVHNLKEWKENTPTTGFPVLFDILSQIISHYENIQPKTAATAALKIRIFSFSYRKQIPADESGNGGGFVFDCRGILNPGRFEEYKTLTGRDPEVIGFLEQRTLVKSFLDAAFQAVRISIDDYLQRNFEHLQISFGCTGGQHRSVYCADQLAKRIQVHYGLDVQVTHVEQEAKGWRNGK